MTAYPADARATYVSGTFGPRTPIKLTNGQWSGNFHYAVDIAPRVKGATPLVYAVRSGRILQVGRKTDAGVYIVFEDESGRWRYCHLSAVNVNAGDIVAEGDVIGRMGATGNVTGVHLHLEFYPGAQLAVRIDPLPLIANGWNPATGKAVAPVTPLPVRPKAAKMILTRVDSGPNEGAIDLHAPGCKPTNIGKKELPVVQRALAHVGAPPTAMDVTEREQMMLSSVFRRMAA